MVFNTLSGRFLGLTIIFVMIAEVLIFVPSVSRFRESYLQNQLEIAQLAAMALLATPNEVVSSDLEETLLETAQVYNVVLRRANVRQLILSGENVPRVERNYDLRDPDPTRLMRSALGVFVAEPHRTIRVTGNARRGEAGEVEIVMDENPMRVEMIAYGLRILYASLAISVGVASLLFLAVRRLMVRPMRRVVDHMIAYRDDPEDSRRIIKPMSGAAEILQAEIALRDMQLALTASLKQKERLAALGGAVAKISHDLRNILTTTQLLADRIERSADPAVKRAAPKLVNSLSRAITLCERTLTFGKAEEPEPESAEFALAGLVAEVVENEGEAFGAGGVEILADVPADLRLRADADQLFRVLTNLVRNAAQAIEAVGRPGQVEIRARTQGDCVEIRVSDTGPGLPEKARENLFQPFRGGVRQGGAGLGLVIAAELVKGHGGKLELAETGPEGTVFRLKLPV